MDPFIQSNLALWDAWASFHPDTEMYNMEAFRNGTSSLTPLEWGALKGRVEGRSLLHLQCHFGQDTLSFARAGAVATGVDFSAEAIRKAKALSAELNVPADFIQAEVSTLSLPATFDWVFTSYGVLTWLPDLMPWAQVVSRHLKPGGRFYIAEFHPAMMMFEFETGRYGYSYFNTGKPYEEVVSGSYADTGEGTLRKECTWSHSLAEIIRALMAAGLELKDFNEFPFSPYNCFPEMEEVQPGLFQCRHVPGAPHLFTLEMQKP